MCPFVCCKFKCLFQSTRPHEARPPAAVTDPNVSRFNPRAHTRRDTELQSDQRGSCCFNPRAHTRRDFLWHGSAFTRDRFNPRAHTRRDIGVGASSYWVGVSIHAPTRGATTRASHHRRKPLFQSTRPHEARPRRNRLIHSRRRFNPRAHTRRDCGGSV